MKYFHIFEELFSLNSLIFALIGLGAAIIVGILMKTAKKNITGLGICLTVYAVAEIVSNFIKVRYSSFAYRNYCYGWSYWVFDWIYCIKIRTNKH